MKTIAAALFAAAVALPSAAIADTVYDPAESEFITAPAPGNPANAAAAAESATRLTETIRVWDPVESEFAVVARAPDTGVSSAVSTNDPGVPMMRVWDPAEAEFMMVPAR
jgi:hypothetical protein